MTDEQKKKLQELLAGLNNLRTEVLSLLNETDPRMELWLLALPPNVHHRLPLPNSRRYMVGKVEAIALLRELRPEEGLTQIKAMVEDNPLPFCLGKYHLTNLVVQRLMAAGAHIEWR
jgi:hypothetical protein